MTSAQAFENSPAFRKWCRAFHAVSGIDVHLLGAKTIEEDLLGVAQSLGLCRMICNVSPECAMLCKADRKHFAKRLRSAGPDHPGPFAMRCFSGLTITAMPVPLADGTIAFLTTGPIFLQSPKFGSPADFLIRRMSSLGIECPTTAIRNGAEKMPVCDRHKFKAAVTLLRLLAEHLSHMSRRMLAAPDAGWQDGGIVRRAYELIERRFTENLRIDELAREIGVSRSHLSHLFRRHMGLTFTEYLSERRVIEMKRLLAEPNCDISVTEALFAAGFQSVSQANRVFRTVTGMAPSKFRASLHS
jgi:AraC-like DNA-binding protein